MTDFALNVFGKTMSKRKVYEYIKYMPNFVSGHARAIRNTVTEIGRLGEEQVTDAIIQSFDPLASQARRSECAFIAVAWYKFFDPFAHQKRKFKFDATRLLPIVMSHPTSLFDYARFVEIEPSPEIWQKLRAMHPEKADSYQTYCEFITIAKANEIKLEWLTLW